jgi:hypothetical protein
VTHSLGRPWTALEDAAIRTRYASCGAAAIAAALDRTQGAVFHRSARIGVIKNRRWTSAEDKYLRFSWGEQNLSQIAAHIRRSRLTTYWRAQKLGLSLGCPDGYEYLSHAAARCGYTSGQLRRILRWACVKLRRAMSRGIGRHRVPHYVVPFDVDEALARWHATETVQHAARRYGVCGDTVRRWLIQAGMSKPAGFRVHWRVETETIDNVVASRVRQIARAA